MISDDNRQVGTYRGVVLPSGMTPRCLDALASLFNDFVDDLLFVEEEEASHVDAAVMAYQIVVGEGQPSRTALLQPQRSGDWQD